MRERMKISLKSLWLFVSVTTLLAPVFIPSAPGSNVLGYATVVMVLLSFPSSLFAAPLMIFVSIALGIHAHTVEGTYLNLVMLFALGLAQWYWIVPKVWGTASQVQTLGLAANGPTTALPTPISEGLFHPFDVEGRTPVERLIRDNTATDERS